MVALGLRMPGVRDASICAFCFRTSAGVRMKHDTDSAAEDAMAWTTGVGSECVNGRRLFSGFGDEEEAELRTYLIPSYVVKNAPARRSVSYAIEFVIERSYYMTVS